MFPIDSIALPDSAAHAIRLVGFIDPALVYLAGLLLLVAAAIGLVRIVRAPDRLRFRRSLGVALLLWLAGTAWLTMLPGHSRRLNLTPLIFGYWRAALQHPFEHVANVALFVPLGIVLVAIGWRVIAAVGLGFALSLTIEVTQYLLNNGRTADVNDLIENTCGALIGALLALVVARLRTRQSYRSSNSTATNSVVE